MAYTDFNFKGCLGYKQAFYANKFANLDPLPPQFKVRRGGL